MLALKSWLSMGGYAIYVWPAYAIAFGIFAGHILQIKRNKKRVLKQLKAWYHKG